MRRENMLFILAIAGALRAMRPGPRPARAYRQIRMSFVRRKPSRPERSFGPRRTARGRPPPRRPDRRRTRVSGGAMPEVFFNGPAGRLEGRFHPAKQRGAPIAVILHPHPQFGGTMNNQIVYNAYYNFAERGFSVLRFNFRGVGRSQGAFDHGQGELSDAASALDWAQTISPEARACWI